MGWWGMGESGGIGGFLDVPRIKEPDLKLVMGDGPADVMDNFRGDHPEIRRTVLEVALLREDYQGPVEQVELLKKLRLDLCAEWVSDWQRDPHLLELQGCLDFCMEPERTWDDLTPGEQEDWANAFIERLRETHSPEQVSPKDAVRLARDSYPDLMGGRLLNPIHAEDEVRYLGSVYTVVHSPDAYEVDEPNPDARPEDVIVLHTGCGETMEVFRSELS